MAHDRQKQSTGGKSNLERHEDKQKQENERKKQTDEWVPKGETKAERDAREERLKNKK